ncbi:hypothetical protein AOLI_G00014050 [Acnodon oligacanthus]
MDGVRREEETLFSVWSVNGSVKFTAQFSVSLMSSTAVKRLNHAGQTTDHYTVPLVPHGVLRWNKDSESRVKLLRITATTHSTLQRHVSHMLTATVPKN